MPLVGKEYILGMMAGNITASGWTVACMDKEISYGRMEEGIKDRMSKIRKKDLGFILGQMAENMKANGKMDSSTGLAGIRFGRANQEKAGGKMARGLHGLKIRRKINNE